MMQYGSPTGDDEKKKKKNKEYTDTDYPKAKKAPLRTALNIRAD